LRADFSLDVDFLGDFDLDLDLDLDFDFDFTDLVGDFADFVGDFADLDGDFADLVGDSASFSGESMIPTLFCDSLVLLAFFFISSATLLIFTLRADARFLRALLGDEGVLLGD
jgi:hypothetical protein